MISVADVTEHVQNRRSLETARTEQAQLVRELSAANGQLTEVNKELLDSNEELQVANEELVLTHEELQATLEEFETSNEELQATNEELETSNEELRARGMELQEVTDVLENERARLTEMVQLAPFSIVLLRGPDLIVEAFNARYGATNGDRVEGRPLAQVFDQLRSRNPDIVELAREVYEQDAPRVTPRIVAHLPTANGTQTEAYFVYTLVPTHDTDGKVSGVVVYAADVTAQRTREAQEELNRLRLIFQHAEQIALALYNAETAALVIASPRYLQVVENMDSSKPHDVIGSVWHNLECITPRHESIEQWNHVLHTGEALRLPEVRAAHGEDGERPVWDWSLIPIKDSEGKVRYVLVSAVEITDQVRVREELQRLDRLKDEFLSVASHELRTPMTPLMGFADMLARMIGQDGTGTNDARMTHMVGSIQGQLRRLNRLVEDLLDVARLQSGKFTLRQETVVLNDLLAQTLGEARMLSQEHEITLDLPNDTLRMQGDPARIQQIVMNLVQNAIKHADTSKQIDIRLRCVRDDATSQAWAEVAVQDYGPGIAPEVLPSLFERFYQGDQSEVADRRSRTGLGLGLYIAKQLVEQHGGTIGVQSVVGQGATFTVRLPLMNGVDPPPPRCAPPCLAGPSATLREGLGGIT